MCDAHAASTITSNTEESEFAECPVMVGSRVNKAEAQAEGLVREFDGRSYYLCCESCAAPWDADPARYAKA